MAKDKQEKIKHTKSSHSSKNVKKETKGDLDELDDRFAEIKNDPRYMEMPQKAKKVKIDKERFKKMFSKKSEFNTIGKFDKTGKKINQKDKMMLKYYSIDKDGEEVEEKQEGSE